MGSSRRVLVTAVLATAFALVGAAPASAEVMPDRRIALEHMVTQDCGSCHGLTLKGGLGSPLTAGALTNAEPETLATIILDGLPGTAMPPWRPLLTEEEAIWIARYLKEQPE